MEQCNILLIAAGGIGFRHFQALLNCRADFTVYVVDISADALARAKEYADSQPHTKSVCYFASIDEIDSAVGFRIAILATPSLPRRQVFESLAMRHTVETVIFEKVLFPRLSDYDEVASLLEQHHTAAYVNCPRRTWEVYQSLREELHSSSHITAFVRGSNWGLACNSIHFADLFAFLSGADPRDTLCVTGLLEDKLFESKRKNYIEFYGILAGKTGDRLNFSIECDHADTPLSIRLISDTHYYQIDESSGRMTVQPLDGSLPSVERQIQTPFVSQSTTRVVDNILAGFPAELTGYAESSRLHQLILREFLKKQSHIEQREVRLCPIT